MTADELFSEQMKHIIDLLRSEIAVLRQEQEHMRELSERRLQTLEMDSQDHETRLRTVQESATQFKVLAGLATGGGLVSLITLLKLILG